MSTIIFFVNKCIQSIAAFLNFVYCLEKKILMI